MTVTTLSGKEVESNKARLIQGNYYIIGDPEVEGSGECYKIGDRFYRDSSYIVYDHTIKRYIISNVNLKEGVVEISKSGRITIGKFSNCIYTNEGLLLIDHGGNRHHLLNEDIVSKNKRFLLDPRTGNYYHHSVISVDALNAKRQVSEGDKSKLQYSTCNILGEAITFYNNSNIKNSWKGVPDILKNMADFMDDELTFGLEFESIRGVIPTRNTLRNGLIPLRDGSVSGLEYATIPLSGSEGLLSLYNILEDLETYTDYDNSCSLHIHIGGIPRTEKFCLAMFKTMVYLQDKIFEMFPIYKKYNYGVKRKLYTAPLPPRVLYEQDPVITDRNVSDNFRKLFKYLTGGISYSEYDNDLSNVRSHPRDSDNSRKWQISTRYLFFNMIPLIFTNHETVEFRIHTPTYDKSKVFNYLGLCLSIVNFVKRNQNNILESPEFCRNEIRINRILRKSLFRNATYIRNEIERYVQERMNYSYGKASRGEVDYDESKFKYISEYWPVESEIKGVTMQSPPIFRGGRRSVRRINIPDDAVRGVSGHIQDPNEYVTINPFTDRALDVETDNTTNLPESRGATILSDLENVREFLNSMDSRTIVRDLHSESIRDNEEDEEQTDSILS